MSLFFMLRFQLLFLFLSLLTIFPFSIFCESILCMFSSFLLTVQKFPQKSELCWSLECIKLRLQVSARGTSRKIGRQCKKPGHEIKREQDTWVNKLASLEKWKLLIMIYLFDTFFISGKQNESRARWKIASGICRKIVDPW